MPFLTQTGSYQNKDGVTVYTTDVVADRVEFLEWGDRPQRNGQTQGTQTEQTKQTSMAELKPEIPRGFEPIEDDVPF